MKSAQLRFLLSTVAIPGAICLFGGLQAEAANTSARHAATLNYSKTYNKAGTIYQDFTSISHDHDTFVRGRKSMCSVEKSEPWSRSAGKDVRSARSLVKHIGRASAGKHKHTYRDMLKTAKDIAAWGRSKVKPRLGTCHKSPSSSSTVENDLNNVASDLGIQHGY